MDLPTTNSPIGKPIEKIILTSLRDAVAGLLAVIGLFLVINALTLRIEVDGPSMLPTLFQGEKAVVARWVYKSAPIQRFDIVVFQTPDPSEAGTELVKRVIGLPGETIQIENGSIYIDGIRTEAPGLAKLYTSSNGTWELSPGQVFVLGDNRGDSRDSRDWGPLPVKNIHGRVVAIYQPISAMRFVPAGNQPNRK